MSLPSPPSSKSRKKAVSRRGQLLWRLLGGVLLVLVGVLVLLVAAYNSGSIVGVEFSPIDFKQREFNYIRPSWLPVTLQGIRYRAVVNPAADYLREQQWVPADADGSAPRWDLVWDNRMPEDSTAYDARILIRYLHRWDPESNDYWVITWSKAHRDLAAVVWPEVARLARAGSYFRIPELLDAAAGWTGTSEDLQRHLIQLTSADSPGSASPVGSSSDSRDLDSGGEFP